MSSRARVDRASAGAAERALAACESRAPAALAVAAALVAIGCSGPKHPEIGGAHLARASGVYDAPAEGPSAPTVVVLAHQPTTIPNAPTIRLAIDRAVPWAQVKAVLAQTRAQNQDTVFLVGRRGKVRGFRLSDELAGESFVLRAYSDFMSCVAPHRSPKEKCTQFAMENNTFIDVAGTRQIVREAVNVYGMKNIEAQLSNELPWADIVRVVDAARTCCNQLEIAIHVPY